MQRSWPRATRWVSGSRRSLPARPCRACRSTSPRLCDRCGPARRTRSTLHRSLLAFASASYFARQARGRTNPGKGPERAARCSPGVRFDMFCLRDCEHFAARAGTSCATLLAAPATAAADRRLALLIGTEGQTCLNPPSQSALPMPTSGCPATRIGKDRDRSYASLVTTRLFVKFEPGPETDNVDTGHGTARQVNEPSARPLQNDLPAEST